jgi:uncharacterized protein (DUF3820 family)
VSYRSYIDKVIDALMMSPNPELLKELVKMRMPFGKYKGIVLSELPVNYLEWFSREGFPPGKLGVLLETLLVIKSNGLEEILYKLKANT